MEWLAIVSALVMLGVLIYISQPWKEEFQHTSKT